MQKCSMRLLVLLWISLVLIITGEARAMTTNSETLKEELQIFARTISMFSRDKGLETPQQKFAHLQSAFIIFEFFGEQGEEFFIQELNSLLGDWKKYVEYFSNLPMHKIVEGTDLGTLTWNNKEKSTYGQCTLSLLKEKIELNKTMLKHLREEIIASCQQVAINALKLALSKEIPPKDVVEAVYQAVAMRYLKSLNKNSDFVIKAIYEARLASMNVELAANPFQSSESWDAVCKMYFKEFSLEFLAYLSPWEIQLTTFVFHKQTLTFLLGHEDASSMLAKIPQDLIMYIIEVWIYGATNTKEVA